MVGRTVPNLPTCEAPENRAFCAARADVQPLYIATVRIEREADANIRFVAIALYAAPSIWFCVLPELLAIADEMRQFAFGADPPSSAFVVISLEDKLNRAARALGESELMALKSFGAVCLQVLGQVRRFAAPPPFS